jgi:hypothetical protein
MKLVGLVILGTIVSGIAYWLLCILLGVVFPGVSEARAFTLVFFTALPLSFFIGSIVTGYFSHHDIKKKWSLFLIAPALYYTPLLICVALPSNTSADANGRFFVLVIAVVLCWYLSSLSGVALGYFLRRCIAK